MSGAAVQWVGEFLGLAHPVEDAAALAATVPDAAGLILVPAMVGLGAPYWDSAARGLIANLERSHTAAHLARAAVDAIAFQVADVLEAMEAAAHVRLARPAGRWRRDAQRRADADAGRYSRPACASLRAGRSLRAWRGRAGWSRARLVALDSTNLRHCPRPCRSFEPRCGKRRSRAAARRVAARRETRAPHERSVPHEPGDP